MSHPTDLYAYHVWTCAPEEIRHTSPQIYIGHNLLEIVADLMSEDESEHFTAIKIGPAYFGRECKITEETE